MTDSASAPNGPGQRRAGRVGTRRRRSRADAGPPPARVTPPPGTESGAVDPPPGASGADAPLAATADVVDTVATNGSIRPGATVGSGPRARREGGRRGRSDSGSNAGAGRDAGRDGPWRELTGSGRSQVSQAAAMRARDADRPTAADLAEAERDVVVQRRNWTPGG